MSDEKTTNLDELDKEMLDVATKAAARFCFMEVDPSTNVASNPYVYLRHAVPYLHVRALHRQEALQSEMRDQNANLAEIVRDTQSVLEETQKLSSRMCDDSKTIKRLTWGIVGFTVALVFLTCMMLYYAWELSQVMKRIAS